MKDLSVTQEYLLLALNKGGKLSIWRSGVQTSFIVAALLELLSNGDIKITGKKKKVEVAKELNEEFNYLLPIYNYIKDSKSKTLKVIASDYIFAFTSKKINKLIMAVGNSLVDHNCATKKVKKSLFGKRIELFYSNISDVDHIIQKLRAEFLEEGTLMDETIILTSLLNKTSLLKKYFSKYESSQFKERLKEIKASPTHKMIKEILDYIDGLYTAMIVASTSNI